MIWPQKSHIIPSATLYWLVSQGQRRVGGGEQVPPPGGKRDEEFGPSLIHHGASVTQVRVIERNLSQRILILYQIMIQQK